MAQGGGARLMEMLLDDAELRRAFRKDPVGVSRRVGIELDDDARAALASFDWDGSNAELRQRISKQSCASGCGE